MRIALPLFFVFFSLSPNGADVQVSLRDFEARYAAAQTLTAKFLETYRENGRVVRMEAGDAYFLRPGRMRWDYQSPENNTFLADGKYVWFYAPADHTATRMPAKESDDWRTPLAFLTSHMKLSRICARMEPARDAQLSQPNGAIFSCTLRGSPQQRSGSGAASSKGAGPARPVLFELSQEGALRRIVIPEEGGMELEFSFSQWRWNPPLDKKLFEFKPPPDTVIVDGLLPDTPGLRQ